MTWRNKVRQALEAEGFHVRNPMDRDYRFAPTPFLPEQAAKLVDADLSDIDSSTVVFAYCWKISVGTSMEVFYAFMNEIPVVLLTNPGDDVSPWLTHHSDLHFTDIDEAIVATIDLLKD